jgi:hypothetical protein
MSEPELQHCMFVVDDKPYCLWDWELQERMLSFLDGIDPQYFTYLAEVHNEALEGEQKQYAALAIRTAYAQALETLFAFLGAALQAPYCVPAWLAKYSNQDLDKLIGKIQRSQPIYSIIGYQSISWRKISDMIHVNLVFEDKEKEQTIKQGFGDLWQHCAADFLSDLSDTEYNSIKHGFRVRSGGFYAALGLEEQPGVPALPENMRLFGRSDFGSSFLTPQSISNSKDDKHHIRLKRQRLNWNPEDMLYGLHLITMSLNNIISCLKVLNGIGAETVQFQSPQDAETFKEPWKRHQSMGFTGLSGPEYPIEEDGINKFPKSEILAAYKRSR